MLRTFVLSVGLVACATGTPTLQTPYPGEANGKPQVQPKFPNRLSAAVLPTAQPFAPRLFDDDALTAAVDVCVRPNGETAGVVLRQSSGDRRFDAALLGDVAKWHYQPFDAAPGDLACERATIRYVP